MVAGADGFGLHPAAAVQPQGELPQTGEDVGTAVMLHALVIFSPKCVALTMAAVFNVPVPTR